MKRIAQLQPLSREHHLGLSLGFKASQCTNNIEEINHYWQLLISHIQDDLQSHFWVEENLIVTPLLTNHSDNTDVQELCQILIQHHNLINQLSQKITPTLADVQTLGQYLYDHIRFEERQLFPLAERLLTAEQLNQVYQKSNDKAKRLSENR